MTWSVNEPAAGSVPVLVSLHSTTTFKLDCKLDGEVVSPVTASDTALKTPRSSPVICRHWWV